MAACRLRWQTSIWRRTSSKVVSGRVRKWFNNARISRAQQRSGLRVKLTLFQNKEHRHHDQRQMMVPAPPAPDWVIAQPDVRLALLQGAFDSGALALHERLARRRRVGRGVAKALFDRGRVIALPAHEQIPWAGLGLFTIPPPHPMMEHLHGQRAFGALAQGHIIFNY